MPPTPRKPLSSNFAQLREHDEQLLRLGVLAERYFAEDPNTSLLKLRQLAELLAQLVASNVGLYGKPDEGQYELLGRLRDHGILPREIYQLFGEVRRVEGTIGRVLILSPRCKAGIINPRLVKFSLHASINREFIALYLRSPLAQSFFTSKIHGGTMDILNLGLLRELPILLPALPEQQEIVRRVEELFAFADRIEARLATAQKTVERLTPAILAKAFRGELVAQEPNDESAGALLERLRVTREVTTSIRKRTGAKSWSPSSPRKRNTGPTYE
ncbi:MAG: restriction endonuclease subunit S [Luteolibacter sp.]